MTKPELKIGRFRQNSWNNEPPDESEDSPKLCDEVRDFSNTEFTSADVRKTFTDRNRQVSTWQSIWTRILMIILLFTQVGYVSAGFYHPVERDRDRCPDDISQCNLYGQTAKDWSDYCFPGKCPPGTIATCINDDKRRQRYICLSEKDNLCEKGYHGNYRFVEERNEIELVKEKCPAGFYTKMKQDCSYPCQPHLEVDLEKYIVWGPPAHDGRPAIVMCNIANGYCPINKKLGMKFMYEKDIHKGYVEPCGKREASAVCLDEIIRQSGSKNNREVNFTTTSVKNLSSNTVVPRNTQPEATVSSALPKSTDSDKGVPKKSGLTEFQIGMIVAGVIGFLLLFLVVVLVVYLCCKYRKFPFLKDTASDALVEIESGSDSSGSMKKSPMVNTNTYYELNDCRVYLNRNESSSESVNEGSSHLSSGTGGSVEEDQENMELLDAGGTTPEEE